MAALRTNHNNLCATRTELDVCAGNYSDNYLNVVGRSSYGARVWRAVVGGCSFVIFSLKLVLHEELDVV